MEFESHIIKTDVTSVRIWENFILAGIGNFLNIFTRNGDFLKKVKIFDSHKIHGIEMKNNDLFLYGGCFMQSLECDLKEVQLTNLHRNQIDDWILTAKWLENRFMALITMKNKLKVFNDILTQVREVECSEKCILYSAFIISTPFDLVILSGTVFGEIIVWRVGNTNIPSICQKLQGHNGVIFSLDYNQTAKFIASTSDDRSTILWQCDLEKAQISQFRKFYGHSSRIFRCLILDDYLVTGGEDSCINVWNFRGDLLNKISTNQGGAIWALDSREEWLVAGGGACGILLASLITNSINQRLAIPLDTPKQVGFMQKGVVVLTDRADLFYYQNKWVQVCQLDKMKSIIMEVSKCRHLLAFVGYHGEIVIYEESETLNLVAQTTTETTVRICAFHWLSCQFFLICDKLGKLGLHNFGREIIFLKDYQMFEGEKELWSTDACLLGNGDFAVGDRRGNIYLFKFSQTFPVRVFRKAHSHLGVTFLKRTERGFFSMGRDGNVKIFQNAEEPTTNKLPFSWLAKFSGKFVLGFSSDNFLVYDYENRKNLVEVACGGGHRSWDFSCFEDSYKFVFLKDKMVNFVTWEKVTFEPTIITENFHSSTVNTLCKISLNNQQFIVSGGEDTTIRISQIGKNHFHTVKILKSHLSSVKVISVYKSGEGFCMVSGGGRGQILLWKVSPNLDFSLQHNFYQSNHEKLMESETRIMDLHSFENRLFAANSDGNINIYNLENYQLERHLEGKKCVTKIFIVEQLKLLVAMSTEGTLTFWDLHKFEKLGVWKIHQSGIVSCHSFMIGEKLLILSGGDDNCAVLSLFDFGVEIKLESEVRYLHHCAQITGSHITNNYFFTASVDQKLLVYRWSYKTELESELVAKYDSSIADIQGFQIEENDGYIDVYLFGKGCELIQIKMSPT